MRRSEKYKRIYKDAKYVYRNKIRIPHKGCYDDGTYCCALAACYIKYSKNAVITVSDLEDFIEEKYGLTRSQISDFILGFDNRLKMSTEAYKQGRALSKDLGLIH